MRFVREHQAELRQAPFAAFLVCMTLAMKNGEQYRSNNTALPMLELSHKYATAAEPQKDWLAAAGEAMLARGVHASLGVFFSCLLPTIAALLLYLVMLQGKVFSRVIAFLGIGGSALMMVYSVLVTFAPQIKSMAMAFAMPGGLLMTAWMVMVPFRLFRLGNLVDSE